MKADRAIAAFHTLCRLNLHPDALVPAVLEALHAIVPSYRNLFDWTDEQGNLLRYFIEGPIDTAIAQLYFDEFHNKLEADAMPAFHSLHRAPLGIRSAQELEHTAFFNSALYNEIWRPQGFNTRMEAVVRSATGRLIGSMVLYRATSDPRFTPTEERRLASLLPAFAEAMESHGAVATVDQFVSSRQAPETILLTLKGRVCHASPGAHALMLMADGGASRTNLSRPLDALANGLLPQLIARLVREQLPHLSIARETSAARLLARASLLKPLHADAEPLVQVILQCHEPLRVALARALHALPLTPTQMTVCQWLYHGQSHPEISQRMGVSTSTVVSHVRATYHKLGVRSAFELRAVLDQQMRR